MTGSTMSGAVDTTAGNFKVTGSVAPGDYGGAGLQFLQCVNTTMWHGFTFTLGGDNAGCPVSFVVQTFEQQSNTQGGGCDKTMVTCYQFPKISLTFGTSPMTIMFSDLMGGFPVDPTQIGTEIVGLQWQFDAPASTGTDADGGTSTTCQNIAMTIDDVSLVP
jgi:hypothetical protein